MSVKIRPYKNGGFEVDVIVQYPDGSTYRERKKAPVPSKSGARRWGEARERELFLAGPKQKEKKNVPTLSEFAPRYIDGHARANRQKASSVEAKESIFRNHLIPRLGNKSLDEIGDEDVQKLKAALTSSRKTINNVLSVLNHTLKVAMEWQVIDRLPCRVRLLKVAVPEMSFYDFAEFERLVEAARTIDPRLHIAVLLAGEAGLRLGEIIALEQRDIDHQRGIVSVRRSAWRDQVDVPKGGRARRVPMTRRLAAALRGYRHLRGDRVLYRDDGQPLTPRTLGPWLAQAERRAGLDGQGAIHKLRHSFCSHLAMRGAPARAIQELAGHRDLTTTQRYMHLSPAAIEGAIRLLDRPGACSTYGDILETSVPEVAKT